MVLLRLFVAFWAAEIMEEKKPLADGVVAPLSAVGVRGARVILDSLLGTMLDDAARPRLCAIMLPEALASSGSVGGSDDWLRFGDGLGCLGSVGVGGVFTMTGVALSLAGGVRGGASVLRPLERRRKRSVGAILAAASASSTDWLRAGLVEAPFGFVPASGDGSSGLAATAPVRSGLGLTVPVELFFDLKTSLKRPTGDDGRPALESGSARLLLLDFNFSPFGGSGVSARSPWIVADRGGGVGAGCDAGWTSGRFSAWTIGDDVVK